MQAASIEISKPAKFTRLGNLGAPERPNRKVPSFFLTRHTGDAQLEFDGSITPVLNMSLRISSSDSFAANGGLRGDCLIGRASPVDILLDDITKP